jgi:hypothetical protein
MVCQGEAAILVVVPVPDGWQQRWGTLQVPEHQQLGQFPAAPVVEETRHQEAGEGEGEAGHREDGDQLTKMWWELVMSQLIQIQF